MFYPCVAAWELRASVAALLLLLAPPASAQLHEPRTVRIGVLSLFHPDTLILTVDHPVTLHLDATTSTLPPNLPLVLHSTPTGLVSQSFKTRTLTLPSTTFTLAIPNKLTRTYRGALTLTSRANILIPVVTMDAETAVASIVAAESPPHAPFEALKAQAIAARSYLLANLAAHQNSNFDACDTTHCQFLRAPPPPSSQAAIATQATRNLVLTWRSSPSAAPRIVPAMYSRTCGGHTRPHPTAAEAYPFYTVRCAFCLRHPESFDPHSPGHGIGLCQLGAADLARHGAPYPQILSHFYPNTTLTALP